LLFALIKSPKSVALAVDAIVIWSISSVLEGVCPPAKVPFIVFEATEPCKPLLAVTRSPKSEALPVVAIVI